MQADKLGDEIATLAAHIQAATCRWLALVRRFDEEKGWMADGARSCAEWLAWRCSMDMTTAREHVRVAHRLAEFPLTRRAFGCGEISYSKVRAITRLQNVEHEEGLLRFARAATASQLERTVRTYRGIVAVDADPQAALAERSLSWRQEEDGTVSFRGRLTAEDGELLIAAIEAVREGMDAQLRASAEAPELDGWDARACRRADALMQVINDRAAHERQVSSGGDRCEVSVHVDADALAGHVHGATCETSQGVALSQPALRRLCCDSSLVAVVEREGRTVDVGRRTRSIPPAIRRAMRRRDQGCRFPGCSQTRHIDGHHIEHWVEGGPTALGNLLSLCSFHHPLVHEHGYTISGTAEDPVFHRPDGTAVALPPACRGDRRRLYRTNLKCGIRPDRQALMPTDGGRMDMGLAIDAMLRWAPPPDASAEAPAFSEGPSPSPPVAGTPRPAR